MSLTTEEQKFYDWVKQALPNHYFTEERMVEMLNGFAKMYGGVDSNNTSLFSQTLIGTATNQPPDFLDLHAQDRGTNRQLNETDAALRARLQNIPDALTVDAITQAVQDTLDAAGLVGDFGLLELRPNKAFFSTNTADTGTGAVIDETGGLVNFTPNTGLARPPQFGEYITISGSANPLNDGTFEVLGLDENAVLYENLSAVDATDATLTWSISRVDIQGSEISGFADAYMDRGFRTGLSSEQPPPPAFIVILPYPCTAATSQSVVESLRQKRGAGIVVVVECRTTP